MKTIICDLDGTLFNIDHRLHFIKGEIFPLQDPDWDGFFAACKDDTPNQWCVDLLKGMEALGHNIIFVSGRNKIAADATFEALKKIGLDRYTVHMRGKTDHRPDYKLKEEFYENVLKNLDILFVVEDRGRVVEMWRSKGLTVLQCDEGEF